MKQTLWLLIFCINTHYAKSQTLDELNRLRISATVDEADNILSKMGFTYDKSDIQKIDTSKYNVFFFKKESSNIDSSAQIILYKKQKNGWSLFDVGFYTYSANIFNELKRQCQEVKKCVLKKEVNQQNGDYIRYFSDGPSLYEFIISPPTKYGDINLYGVIIKI